MYGLTMMVFGLLLPIVETATSGTNISLQVADMVTQIKSLFIP